MERLSLFEDAYSAASDNPAGHTAALDLSKERKVHERPHSIPHGQDNTQDYRPMDRDSHTSSSSERLSMISDAASTDHSHNAEDQHSQVPMPTSPTGRTTFAHERALRTRIRAGKLAREGEYDMKKYTPTFIHDCLMLPGSLANLLGKASARHLIHSPTHIPIANPLLVLSRRHHPPHDARSSARLPRLHSPRRSETVSTPICRLLTLRARHGYLWTRSRGPRPHSRALPSARPTGESAG